MSPETQAKLERFLPIGVVVQLKDNKVLGKIEHSFSMDDDVNRVRVWWSGKAYSMLGEHQLDGMKDAAHNSRKPGELVFDALSEECPIEVDWESWLADLAMDPGDKYRKRNAKFTVKPHGVWQLRAMAAEQEIAKLKPRHDQYVELYRAEAEVNNKIRALLNPPEPEEENAE